MLFDLIDLCRINLQHFAHCRVIVSISDAGKVWLVAHKTGKLKMRRVR